jgi:hypothetical protein
MLEEQGVFPEETPFFFMATIAEARARARDEAMERIESSVKKGSGVGVSLSRVAFFLPGRDDKLPLFRHVVHTSVACLRTIFDRGGDNHAAKP